MNRLAGILVALGVLVSASAARADIAPDDCDDLELGDACETVRGEPGTCQEGDFSLYCVANTGDGGAGGSGGNPSRGGGGTSSEGGGGSGGGSGGEADDGCTASRTRKVAPGLALVAGAALALVAATRRRKRG